MRYALLMGSVKEMEGVTIPIDSGIVKKQLNDFKNSLEEFTGTGEFRFSWKDSNSPEIIRTPTFGNLMDKLDELTNISRDDEFMFYYFGHGYVNSGKLVLGYKSFDLNSDDYTLNRIYDKILTKGFTKISIILDCCYAGRGFENMLIDPNKFYAIGASYNSYTYLSNEGGEFSQQFIRSLRAQNLSVLQSQNKTEITLKDIFQEVKTAIELLDKSKQPSPFQFGNLGDQIILKKVKNDIYNYPSFDGKVKVNSLYNKLYFILTEIIGNNRLSLQQIHESIIHNRHRPFLIDERNNEFVGVDRVNYYLKILSQLSFVNQTASKFELNSFGLTAIRNEGQVYNKILIKRLYHWALGKQSNQLSWDQIADYRSKTIETITSLISDFQIPSYINFKSRFETLHGEKVTNDRDDLKTILSLLSYTKEIRRLDSNSYFTK